MRIFTVDEKGRLLDYLFKVLADTKKTRVRQFLKFQAVSVNGAVTTRFDYALHPGDKVGVQRPKTKTFIPSLSLRSMASRLFLRILPFW